MDINPATRGHALVIPRDEVDPLVLPWRPTPGDLAEIQDISFAYFQD